MRRLLLLCFAALLPLSACAFGESPKGKAVFLQDAALEYAIREYLKKPGGDLLEEDIAGFKVFQIEPDRITLNGGSGIPLPSGMTPGTLADLPMFPEAGSLLASGVPFEGLEAIADCPRLQRLGINRVDTLENLDFLAGLAKLKVLSVHSNPNLADFSPVAGLTWLEELDLHYSGIEETGFLAPLTELRKLSLHNNRISDLSVLKNFPGLTELDLHANRIEDISALSELHSLTLLRLEANRISDLTPLAGKESLRMLALDYNQVAELSALEHLPALMHLKLTNNPALGASQVARLRETLPEGCKIEWS